MRLQYFLTVNTFISFSNFLHSHHGEYAHNEPLFSVFANILERRQYLMNFPDFVAANICVYFQYLFMHLSMRQYFWRNCFNLRFKINVVVMII
jgi:hypothetical protein